MRKITENSTAITNFYNNNVEIIGMKKEDFFQWIENNYYAKRVEGKFIATSLSEENGYMVNKRKVIIDIDDFTSILSYMGYVTPKGQEHILNTLENTEVE